MRREAQPRRYLKTAARAPWAPDRPVADGARCTVHPVRQPMLEQPAAAHQRPDVQEATTTAGFSSGGALTGSRPPTAAAARARPHK